MPESFVQLPADGVGKKLRSYDKGVPGHDQYVIPTSEKLVSFAGRSSSFRTPGRAGTAGQKLFAIHNTAGSAVLVNVKKITVDLTMTVVKAVTVLPPTVRLHRFTAVPLNGTVMSKVADDTNQSSNASVTVWGDASADGTSSTVALTITIPTGSILEQEYAPRLITAAGYEPADRMHFVEEGDIVLRPLQGVAVELVYTLATQNPITDMWTASCWWDEFTLP